MALLKNGTRIHGFGVVEGQLSVGSIVTTNSTPLQIASSITRSSSNTTGTIVITNGGGLATRGNIYSGNIVITGAVNSNGITFTDGTRQTTSALEKSNTQTQSLAGSLIVGGASVNYLQFTGNTTSNGPVLSTEGTDTNIDINIRPKGIGAVNVETSGTSTFLNVRNPIGLAIANVTASGACTRSQIVTFAPGNGSEANLLIYTTGAAGNPPASAKISSSTGKSTLQVEGGQSASINIITLGASSTATANLQIRSGIGGSASLKIFGDGTPAYANIGSTTSVGSQVNIISSLPSTSNTTGALVITGGVGVTGNLNVFGTAFFSSNTAPGIIVNNIVETANVVATAPGANVTVFLANNSIVYFTSNATANSNINYTYTSTTLLNSVLANGQSISAVVMMTQGSTAYFANTVSVDGTNINTRWQNGVFPVAGSPNGIDVYTHTIIKTGNNQFVVLGSQNKFA
jgi:hypothetical protein